MVDRNAIIHRLMEYSEPPAYKWLKLWDTYSALSTNRLLEIQAGFRLAAKGIKRRADEKLQDR
jgi:hypothetical protein